MCRTGRYADDRTNQHAVGDSDTQCDRHGRCHWDPHSHRHPSCDRNTRANGNHGKRADGIAVGARVDRL